MMDNIKISIIVPAYNIEKYVEATVKSILSQSYANIEVIIVNDGSSDNTFAILDKLALLDNRITVIHKDNGGVTSARLLGLANAKGEYIAFIDGDDIIEPEMFSKLLRNALKHNADISHCGYQMIFPDRIDYYYNTGKTLIQNHERGLSDLLTGEFIEPGLCNKLYKKELFIGLENWLNKDIRINEDLLMNYYLFNKASASIYEDFCPYHYLKRADSASSSKINIYKLKDPLNVLEIIYNQLDNSTHKNIVIQRILRQMITISSMELKQNPTLIKPYRSEIRSKLKTHLISILKNKDISKKLKIMSAWTAIWPWSYGFVHRLYSKITGLDKKYDI